MSGIRLYLGRCGSGKTFKIQQDVAALVKSGTPWRVLVLDVNREFGAERAAFGERIVRCRSFNDVRKAIAAGERCIAYVGAVPAEDWAKPNPLGAVADELVRIATEHPPTIVVLPEAHNCCAEGYPLPASISQVIHRWRHIGVNLWMDTQNMAHIKKEAVKACELLYLFATGSKQDLDAIAKLAPPLKLGTGLGKVTGGGRLIGYRSQTLDGAVREMSAHVHTSGERGWHIRVETARPGGPWEAVRYSKGKLARLPL